MALSNESEDKSVDKSLSESVNLLGISSELSTSLQSSTSFTEGELDEDGLTSSVDSESLASANVHRRRLINEIIVARHVLSEHRVELRPHDIVAIKIDISDIITNDTAQALKLVPNELVVVTLDFSEITRLPSDDSSYPLPKFNATQFNVPAQLPVAPNIHLRGIVERYLEDNLISREKPMRLSRSRDTHHAVSSSRRAPGVEVNDLVAHELYEFGFHFERVCMALIRANNQKQAAVEMLYAMGSEAFQPLPRIADTAEVDPTLAQQLQAMGFPEGAVQAALKEAGNNIELALELLISGTVPSSPLADGTTTNAPRAGPAFDQSQSLTNSGINLFVGLIGYVRARLIDYTSYCMVCHRKHSCASLKPLVCGDLLCLFKLVELIPKTLPLGTDSYQVCLYTRCEEGRRVATAEVIWAAVRQCFIGITAAHYHQTVMELCFHHYLPGNQAIEFLNAATAQGRTIRSIESIALVRQVMHFDAALERVRVTMGSEECIIRLGFYVSGIYGLSRSATEELRTAGCVRINVDPAYVVEQCQGGGNIEIVAFLLCAAVPCGFSFNEYEITGLDTILPCFSVMLSP